jgi:hypothetical protein
MANYTKSTDFAAKDDLATGNAAKIVKGTEIDNEFNAIQTAVATKLDTSAVDYKKRIVSYSQVVKASDQTINTTTKTDLSMDLAITPSSVTNKILIILNVEVLHRQNGDDSGVELALYVDDVLEKEMQHQFASSSSSVTNAGLGGTITIVHLDSPATTSEVTYGVKANSMFVGGDGSEFYGTTSTITALEIEA